jgi:hypothetical protein
MKRNLKTLGLALMIASAMSAIAASAASGQVGTVIADGLVTLTGTQTGEASKNQLTAFGSTIQCPSAVYTGHKYNETPHKAIPSGSSTLTITPHYGSCTSKIVGTSFPVTVDMNGCDYVLHLEETTAEDEYRVKTTAVCPVGQHITITIFATAAKHTENKPFCHETITESAAGYPGLTAKDTTNGKVDISGEIKGIFVDKKSPTESILCPEETTNTATLSQDITVGGKSEAGAATSISLSEESVVPKVGTLTSDGLVTLTGTQTGEASKNQLTAFGSTIQCPSAVYTGHKYNETPHKAIPSGSSTLTITPHYGSCTSKIVGTSFPVTVDMNGCDYVLHLEETTAEDEYRVKTTAVCPVGQHITITIFATAAKHTENKPFCHETITESAAGYPGLTAKDTTNGKVDISGEIKGIFVDKKSPTESILCPEETTNTATLSQDLSVEGKSEAGAATSISLSEESVVPSIGTVTSTGPVTLQGVQTGFGSNVFGAFGGTIQCANAIYTGHKENVTPHTFIPNGSSTITVTPHYGQCTGSLGGTFPTTVDMNGCDYVLSLGETSSEDQYGLKMTTTCPTGKHITMTTFTSAAKHTSNEAFCHYTITENTEGYNGLTAQDTTNGKVDISGEIRGISIDKKSPTGSILCPEETTNVASQILDITVEGKNEAGGTTSISLSHL